MKKIVMVAAPVHPVPPRKGAAVEWWMYQTCRRLTVFEPHIISIAAAGYPVSERRADIRFHRIRIGRLYRRLFQKILGLDPWSYARRVARRLDAIQPDIVHVHNAPALFAELTRHYHGPTHWVLHMHNEMPVADLPAGATLFTVSRYLKEWYGARLPDTDIRVVTNGVDTDAFCPQPAQETATQRAHLHLPMDKKIILYAGRMSPEKGPLDLLHAFRELLKRRQDVFLLLIGELRTRGAEHDRRADYGRHIQETCVALGTRCYHAGVVNPESMHRYYPLADLVVVPSEFEEPFGMVAIEAMSCGTAVLASRKGGLPEIIADGVTGHFLDNTKDAGAFADSMNKLLVHPDQLAQVGRKARSHVVQHHDWRIVCAQLESVYQELLA